MSYALRNSIILLGTLLLMGIGGWLFLKYGPNREVTAYEAILDARKKELATYQSKAATFPDMQGLYIRELYRTEFRNKDLFFDRNVADFYDFVRRVNEGPAATRLNFTLIDSVSASTHGYLQFQVDGEGTYRNFYNFINQLEQSRPIASIRSVKMQPKPDSENRDEVVFTFNIRLFHLKGDSAGVAAPAINRNTPQLAYNPFSPLIYAIPSNDGGLTDVEQSRLIAVTTRSAFLVSRSGMDRIDLGGSVYLGTLERVNPSAGTATFRLNKGGIEETVTLRIGQP